MRIFKSFLQIGELFFPMIIWLFIYVVFFSFSWFFNEPVNPMVYVLTLIFLLCLYGGYYFNGKYTKYNPANAIKGRLNLLIPALVGFSSIIMFFLGNIANLNKSISTIRDDRMEQVDANAFYITMYTYLFPIFLGAFILVNFNNFKYKKLINILALLSCLAFIPINGGRTNFLIFGSVYFGIYLFKNFDKLKAKPFKNFFRFTGIVFLIIIMGATFSIVRLGVNSDAIISEFYKLQFISNTGLNTVLSLPYGVAIATLIYTFYDYTGGNIYYLSIFYNNADKLGENTHGMYNFYYFARFFPIDHNKVHSKIDQLYLNSDIKYNVWSTALRDFYPDFGWIGTYVFIFILAILLFHTRKYLYKSYAAQIVFFQLMAFFLFAPFHSIFYLDPFYGLTFVVALIFFFIYKLSTKAKNKFAKTL